MCFFKRDSTFLRLFSIFRRGKGRGEWVDDDSDARQTQAEEETSWAFAEAPGSPWAPSVGEGGGRRGQGKQIWDGCVKATLTGYKPEHQYFDRLWVSPSVQWWRHIREYMWCHLPCTALQTQVWNSSTTIILRYRHHVVAYSVHFFFFSDTKKK